MFVYECVWRTGIKRWPCFQSGKRRSPALPSLLTTLNQPHTLQQEFKWRELEEQRKAERLHKRLQQEQAYLLSLQHEPKPQPGDKTKPPSDLNKPQTSTLPPQTQVPDAPQTLPLDSFKPTTDSDETCTNQIPDSPSPPQTDSPPDSDPPQAESLEPDRPAEAVSEVNLLRGSAHSAACSVQLLLLLLLVFQSHTLVSLA